jgi:hypothetical protein
MPTQEEIDDQLEFLKIHRRNLARYLKQQAEISSTHVPLGIANGIDEERNHIKRVKHILRDWGIHVDDHPDDFSPTSDNTISDNPRKVQPRFWLMFGISVLMLLPVMFLLGKSWNAATSVESPSVVRDLAFTVSPATSVAVTTVGSIATRRPVSTTIPTILTPTDQSTLTPSNPTPVPTARITPIPPTKMPTAQPQAPPPLPTAKTIVTEWLNDPSLEQWTSGSGDIWPYWGPLEGSPAITDTDSVHGKYSVRINTRGDGMASKFSSITQKLPPKKRFMLTFHYKTEGNVVTQVVIYKGDNRNTHYNGPEPIGISSQWNRYVMQPFTTDASTLGNCGADLTCYGVFFTVQGTGSIWIDAFQLEEVIP